MSKRSERREAERTARKLAYQDLRQQRSATNDERPAESPAPASCELLPADVEPIITEIKITEIKAESNALPHLENPSPISETQLKANRANAQHSTGPITDAGKTASSRNALKHGLTSKAILLPGEDAAQYQADLDAYINIHQPATEEELRLVQTIVDCNWRIDRIGHLEAAVLLKGHVEFANSHKDQPEIHRGRLISADAYLKYEKQIRNINIQEARLRRTLDKTQAELKQLIAMRRHKEMAALQAQLKAEQATQPKANGFDFSTRSNAAPTSASTTPRVKKRAA